MNTTPEFTGFPKMARLSRECTFVALKPCCERDNHLASIHKEDYDFDNYCRECGKENRNGCLFCDECGKTAKCIHGNPVASCDHCDYLSDLAYDASR